MAFAMSDFFRFRTFETIGISTARCDNDPSCRIQSRRILDMNDNETLIPVRDASSRIGPICSVTILADA